MKSIVIGAATSGASLPVNLFRMLAQRWHRHGARLSDRYRPDRHYMRGPGPKWREKHGMSASALQ
jgi:hypothetical protein